MDDKEETKKKRWPKRVLKITLFTAITVVFLLTVLSFLGGNGDSYKRVIEQIASEQFHHPATLDKLNEMRFYPYFKIDMEGLKIRRGEGVDQTVLEAEKIQIAMDFWDVAFSTGRIKSFNLEGVRADEGILLTRPVTIDRIAIMDPEGKPPALIGSGTIDGEKWTLNVEGNPYGKGRKVRYDFSHDNRFVELSLGSLLMKGNATREPVKNGGVRFKNVEISYPDPFLTGTLLVDVENSIAHITGELQAIAHKDAAGPVTIKPDIIADFTTRPATLSGRTLEDAFTQPDERAMKTLKDINAKITKALSIHPLTELENLKSTDTENKDE